MAYITERQVSPRSSGLEDVLEPDGEAVERRLRELGVPDEILSEAARVGYAKGDFVTAAHPRTYQGTVVWGEITGSMRNGLSVLGWGLDDTDNIARAVSPDGDVVVVAVRGNDRTGIRNRHELLNTHRPRGSAGVRIVRVNAQLELILEEGQAASSEDRMIGLGGTWFYLYNRVGDVVRRELSFARGVSDSGDLLMWKERLILPDIDLGGPPSADTGDDLTPPVVDVPVTRKAG